MILLFRLVHHGFQYGEQLLIAVKHGVEARGVLRDAVGLVFVAHLSPFLWVFCRHLRKQIVKALRVKAVGAGVFLRRKNKACRGGNMSCLLRSGAALY